MTQPIKHSRNRFTRRVLVFVVVTLLVFVLAQSWIAEWRFLSQVRGKPAAAFELTALDGEPVRLSDFRGKPVVLAFWAVG